MSVERKNISDDVAGAIEDLILRGRLEPASRLNEVHLARQLGVSRTPLREGLRSLVEKGLIDREPRRGYFVRDLSIAEFVDLYSIRPILDPAALALAGPVAPRQLTKLVGLNDRLAAASNAAQAIDLDDKWHLELLAGCPNRVLTSFIEQIIRRTRRYELAYMNVAAHRGVAVREHGEILAALSESDMPRACDALRRNLSTGGEPIIEWLRGRRRPAGDTTTSEDAGDVTKDESKAEC